MGIPCVHGPNWWERVLPVLALFKRTSKYLEVEEAMEIVQERAADA